MSFLYFWQIYVDIQRFLHRNHDYNYTYNMIRLIYNHQRNWNWFKALWCSLIFVVNNLIFFYAIIKVCFAQYMELPPLAVSIICLLLLIADTITTPIMLKSIKSVYFFLDVIQCVLVLVSIIEQETSWGWYLSLSTIIRIWDMVYLQTMYFDMVKKYYGAYKVLLVAKIVYLIFLLGNITGCIFYAIDQYLISIQYFGPFDLNPGSYYQGTLLAYTPLYAFQDMNRYTYAMYYSISLISTIAFGDIIGKNWIEDAYVMILLVLWTIGISYIVEQMYNVFRRKKTQYLQLVNDVRFVYQRFKSYEAITPQLRRETINYLIETKWKFQNEQPQAIASNDERRKKLIKESLINNPTLPSFFSNYTLQALTLINYPKGVTLRSNLLQKTQLQGFLIVNGSIWVGYIGPSGKIAGGETFQSPGINYGLQEILAGTTNIYPHLTIKTSSPIMTFIISASKIDQIMEELSEKDHAFDTPQQHRQLAKDKALFTRYKYRCPICHTFDHTLIDCPLCHLVIGNQEIKQIMGQTNRRNAKLRNKFKSKKVRKVVMKHCEDQQVSNPVLEQLLRIKAKLKAMARQDDEKDKQIQHWHSWNIYDTQYNAK